MIHLVNGDRFSSGPRRTSELDAWATRNARRHREVLGLIFSRRCMKMKDTQNQDTELKLPKDVFENIHQPQRVGADSALITWEYLMDQLIKILDYYINWKDPPKKQPDR